MSKTCLLVLIILAKASHILSAQHSQSIDTINIEVEQEESQLSLQSSSGDTKQDPSWQLSRLTDVLTRHTSLALRSSSLGGLATIGARGLGGHQTLISWNGLPIDSPQNGVSDLNIIGLSGVVSLSDQRDAMSPAYMAGQTYELSSIPALGSRRGSTLDFSYGAFAQMRTAVSSTLGGKSSRHRISASWDRAANNYVQDDYRTAANEDVRQADAGYELLQLDYAHHIDLGDKWSLRSAIALNSADREIPPSIYQVYDGATQVDQSIKTSLRLTHILADGEFQMGLSGVLATNVFETDLINKSINDSRRMMMDLNYRRGPLALRLDAVHEAVMSNQYTDLKQRIITNAKINYLWNVHGEWQYRSVLGIQYDDQSTQVRVFPFLELVRRDESIKLAISRHFSLPNFNDLYWPQLGNQDLNSERGWKSEISWRILDLRSEEMASKFELSLSPYLIYLDNRILWRPGQDGLWRPINTDGLISYGSGLSFKLLLQQWDVLLTGHYEYNRSYRLQDVDRNQIIYAPAHSAHMTMGWSRGVWQVKMMPRYQSRVYTSVINEENFSLRPILTLDMQIEYSLSAKSTGNQVSTYLRWQNIGSRRYEYAPFRPMPLGHLVLGAHLDLSSRS